MIWSVLSKNTQKYQRKSGINIQNTLVLLNIPRISRIKNINMNSEDTSPPNHQQTGNHLKTLTILWQPLVTKTNNHIRQ